MNKTLSTCFRRAGDTGPSVDMLDIMSLLLRTDRQPFASGYPKTLIQRQIIDDSATSPVSEPRHHMSLLVLSLRPSGEFTPQDKVDLQAR